MTIKKTSALYGRGLYRSDLSLNSLFNNSEPIPLVPYNMVKGKVFEYQIPYFDYIGDWFRIIEK